MQWNKIRAPQEKSFEELCCQLAAAEPVSDGKHFVRKGTPDAGVECFWRFPGGDEWCWQAKWFLNSPTASQWKQLDDSFRTAFESHERLVRYYVCMPVDLPDARKKGTKSAHQKWEEWIKKWMNHAYEHGRTITFEFWGSHELTTRLTEPRARGSYWYWFCTQSMTVQWFEKMAHQSVHNAGDRYTPLFNIDTPTKSSFELSKRTSKCWSWLADCYYELRTTYSVSSRFEQHEPVKESYEKLRETAERLLSTVSLWTEAEHSREVWTRTRDFPLGRWEKLTIETDHAIQACRSSLQELPEQQEAEDSQQKNRGNSYDDPFRSAERELGKLGAAVCRFKELITDLDVSGANDQCVLLVGKAGEGKTHLLCDLLENDIQEGRSALLFLGEQFKDADPWGQMIQSVGLKCDREQFLGALQAAAQSSGKKAVIYLDALNDGEGLCLWRKHLAGFITEIQSWEWIDLYVSVRDVYEHQVIPDQAKNEFCRIKHTGFSENTYAAANQFFQYFKIEPSTPFLMPEFDNPLFLMLFCKGVQSSGENRIPAGLRGISKVFGFLVDSLDRKLSGPDYLDYDAADRVVLRAVNSLADKMVELGDDQVPKAVAKELLDQILPRTGHSNSLLHHLAAESLVAVTPDWQSMDSESPQEVVRFTYQRLSDHFYVHRLLAQNVDKKQPELAFRSGGALHDYVGNDDACWQNGGVVEALAIQLPEYCGRELPDLVPQVSKNDDVRRVMIESLVWRDAGCFSDATYAFVNKQLSARHQEDVLNAMISLSPIPQHPLNADRLHTILNSVPMPDRDAWWSTFLHSEWGEQRSVDRLVDWAQKQSGAGAYDDEVIRLAGMTLAWFLTTPNRKLRDRATKGLVRLFAPRLKLLQPLLKAFCDVDDPYVTERLMAVAFGAGARSGDDNELGNLALHVYERIFAAGDPPPHILIRDYARQLIELALQRGIELGVDLNRIRPPYTSTWPEDAEIPSKEEVAKHSRTSFYEHIFSKYGDFAKHVTDFSEWRMKPLGEPKWRSPTREQKEFQATLTPKQKEKFSDLLRFHTAFRRTQRRRYSDKATYEQESHAEKRFEQSLQKFSASLRRGSKKRARFEAYLADYFQAPWDFKEGRKVNYQAARRWMVKRVVELGWTGKRFAAFDRNFRTNQDAVQSQESMGKKYCWIALYEMQARCADTFQLSQQNFDNGGVCEGPWEITYCRDIDPSMLVTATGRQSYQNFTQTWWFSAPFGSWESPADDIEWLRCTDNLPDPNKVLSVVDDDGVRWVTLDGYYEWEQPNRPGYRHWEQVTRNLWYKLSGYLVKKSDIDTLLKWSQAEKRRANSMPDRDEWNYHVFLGEFYWGRSYAYLAGEENNKDRWTRGTFDNCPVPVVVATSRYQQEHTASDCSLEDGVYFDLPCRMLVDVLGLSTRHKDGYWYDNEDVLVAFDPSITSKGASVLLFREDRLHRVLTEKGLAVFCYVRLRSLRRTRLPTSYRIF